MKEFSSTLDSLDSIIGARDDRQTAERSLRVFADLVSGDYYSAVHYDGQTFAADIYHLGTGWVGQDSAMATFLWKNHLEHPFARHFLPTRRPNCYRRSEMVSNRDWHGTRFYNELDRNLGIKDMVAIYQMTGAGNIMVLTCGRSNLFRQHDLDFLRPLNRILESLMQTRRMSETPARSPWGTVDSLSKREREVLRWVREGKRNGEISVILGVSTHTVRKHLEKAFVKLGVETRTAAALMFAEHPQTGP